MGNIKGSQGSTVHSTGPTMIYAQACFGRHALLAPTIKDLETQIKGLYSTNPRKLRKK